jgi:hypothetical protein
MLCIYLTSVFIDLNCNSRVVKESLTLRKIDTNIKIELLILYIIQMVTMYKFVSSWLGGRYISMCVVIDVG